MHHIKKNVCPVFLFFMLLFFFGGRSYACASDDSSKERVESNHKMKLITGVISILGEGALTNNKDSLDSPDDIFNTFHSFGIIGFSYPNIFCFEVYDSNIQFGYATPLGKKIPVFISNSSLLI